MWLKPGAPRRAVESTVLILARAALNLCIVHDAPTAWCVLARRRLCLRLATADLLPADAEGVRLPHSSYQFRQWTDCFTHFYVFAPWYEAATSTCRYAAMLDRFNVTVPISRSWFYALPLLVLAPGGSALDTQSWSCRLGLYYIVILYRFHHHRIHFDKCHPVISA